MEELKEYAYTAIKEDLEGNIVDIFESDDIYKINDYIESIPEEELINAYIIDNEVNEFITLEELNNLLTLKKYEETEGQYYDDEMSESFLDLTDKFEREYEEVEYDELEDPNSIAFYYNEHPEDLYQDVEDGFVDIRNGVMLPHSLEIILAKTNLSDEQKDELRAKVEF